ncbi:MAG TPA: NYN domain-containing protein, partial [Miltoncostaeaceae bacterium]|nr:NYN domain-containing protein [Miltoncostaeaceae bacterium]
EMPSAREGAKNRADIQMAVDAMELAYSREHVDNFVIVSGDSDFTPLVGKLRELNKRVIGVGNRESASELLIANCDEFIFYDRLAAEAAGKGATRRRTPSGGLDLNPTELLRETLTALQREGTEWPLASIVKDSMRRKYPAFDESEHGFSTFSKFLEDASTTGIVRLETDPRSGTYRVELGEGRTAPPLPAAPAATADRSGDEAEGGRRRRRRGGRGRSGAGADGEQAEAAPLAEEIAGEIAEVFEVVVTPTPDPDLGTLPPLDEPISYEDMIMLGPPPEVGDDVPELAEATDTTGAPSRSSRRRRRRGAGAEPEPTVGDLEQVDEDTAEAVAEAAEPVAAEPVAETAAPEGEEEAPARRRRRRRATAETDEALAVADEAPTTEGPAEEAAPARRRVRRRGAADEPAVAAEAPAGATPAAEEVPAEEAPTPRRRTTRKKAAETTTDEAADAPAEEAPKPRRRTTRKRAAEPAAEAEAPAAD